MAHQKEKKNLQTGYKENPFVTSTSVLGNDFYGREREIKQVMHFLGKKKEHHLLIHGQRRIGKTSLLLKIKELVNKSPIGKAIFFDLQNKAHLDISEVLADLAREICLAMDLNLGKIDKNVSGSELKNFFKDEFLPWVMEKLPENCQLVLLFDEFDSLGDLEGVTGSPKISNIAYHKFIPLIAEIKEKELPLKFIFAVGRNYKDLDEGRYGQITKSGGQIELSYFDKNELEQLIRSSDTILPFDQEAIDRIYTYTSGHPFFSQCLSSTAFDETDRLNAQSVTPAIVNNSLEATIKSHGGAALWLWRGFLPKDRIVLYLMATIIEERKTLDERNIISAASHLNFIPVIHELNDTLERLVNLKIIHKVNQDSPRYDFYVEFFRKWILMENSVEEISMLLTDMNPEIKHNIHNGHFFYSQGDFKEAEKWFMAVINKFPSHYEALIYLGQIASHLMEKEKKYLEKALKWFSRAYALNTVGTKDEYLSVLKEKLNRLNENGEKTENIQAEIQRVKKGELMSLETKDSRDKYPESPVLVVDDERNFLNSMDFQLRSKGISNVECCSESMEVMPLLKNKKYSVILLDLKMKGITGEELLEKIVGEYPDTPVIILTGMKEIEIAVRCMKKGAFDYLVKLVDTEKLITTIQEALKKENDNKAYKFINNMQSNSGEPVSSPGDEPKYETTIYFTEKPPNVFSEKEEEQEVEKKFLRNFFKCGRLFVEIEKKSTAAFKNKIELKGNGRLIFCYLAYKRYKAQKRDGYEDWKSIPPSYDFRVSTNTEKNEGQQPEWKIFLECLERIGKKKPIDQDIRQWKYNLQSNLKSIGMEDIIDSKDERNGYLLKGEVTFSTTMI